MHNPWQSNVSKSALYRFCNSWLFPNWRHNTPHCIPQQVSKFLVCSFFCIKKALKQIPKCELSICREQKVFVSCLAHNWIPHKYSDLVWLFQLKIFFDPWIQVPRLPFAASHLLCNKSPTMFEVITKNGDCPHQVVVTFFGWHKQCRL